MAAEQLASAGWRVSIYDHMPSPARKLLIAGRGGLNLTHSEALEQFLPRYGAAQEWLAPAVTAFSPQALRDWCEGLGQPTFVGSSGRVFPRSMKAAPLLRAWMSRLEQLGVHYFPRHRWLGWQGEAVRFTSPGGEVLLQPAAVLLALGGASWPRLGADGAWTQILARESVALSPLRPANCGFVAAWSEYFSSRFAGQPLKPVSLTHAGQMRQGEAMITAQGMEGGVVYALSAALREAIAAQGSCTVMLDLRPDMPAGALAKKLDARGSQSLGSFLRKAGFSPLAVALLHELLPPGAVAHSGVALAAQLKALPLTFTATAGMARAISSAGGITRAALTEDYMLRAKPGVFAAGEMLDWEAPTGGYLLQACFSTAVAAAAGIQRWLDAREPRSAGGS